MKIIPAFALLTLLLTSCTAAHPAQPIVPTQTAVFSSPLPSSLTPALTATSAPTPTPILAGPGGVTPSIAAGFVEPASKIWVDVMPAVREYFYYRKKAVVSGDVSVLWKRYPDLKQGMNAKAGINVELNTVQTYGILKPFDGNIIPEGYEKIKVKMSGDTTDVLVHGWEMYLITFGPGIFDETGSEFLIILSLRKQDNLWTVYKTTDITGP